MKDACTRSLQNHLANLSAGVLRPALVLLAARSSVVDRGSVAGYFSIKVTVVAERTNSHLNVFLAPS